MLVTGHTGFKGAWLTLWLQHLGAEVSGLALPPDHPEAAFGALSPWPNLVSHVIDVRDAGGVAEAMRASEPEIVFHLAAQALVHRGYADPVGTYSVNVLGTAHVLEAIRAIPSVRAAVVVTSDKVYVNDGREVPFREDDPLGGSDPYSGSKACTELMVETWRRSFGSDAMLATARAGNVIGGGDAGSDRLLVDARLALEAGRPLILRRPDATRPWQFVLEPLLGYVLLAERMVTDPRGAPEALNFGPDPGSCVPVREVVERLFSLWGDGAWEPASDGQVSEASSLALDASRAEQLLGWRSRLDIDAVLEWTVAWWRCQARGGDMRALALDQIASYEKLVQG